MARVVRLTGAIRDQLGDSGQSPHRGRMTMLFRSLEQSRGDIGLLLRAQLTLWSRGPFAAQTRGSTFPPLSLPGVRRLPTHLE